MRGSSSSRKLLRQQEHEEALESVRSLNEWRASSQPSLQTTPPPTDRLYLDLDSRGVGHGKSAEQKQAFLEQRAAREAKRHQVIVSDIKRSEEIQGEERKRLEAQLKVLERLSPRCKGVNDTASKMLSMFRKCLPDEFGFVSKQNFVRELRQSYGLSRFEANELFDIASQKENEITYKQFREAFSRIDKSTTFIPESYRPILKRDAMPAYERPISAKPVHGKSFQNMTPAEREDHRQRNRIINALEQSPNKIQARFKKSEEESGGANIRIRTKLTYPEVAEVLHDFGIEVTPRHLAALYRENDSENGLTFSQLHRRTADYFAKFDNGGEEIEGEHRNMELKGQYLGCRKMITGGDKTHRNNDEDISRIKEIHNSARGLGVEAHNNQTSSPDNNGQQHQEQPARRRRRRRHRRRHTHRLPTVSESLNQIPNPSRNEDNLWKAHWTDKTIPKTDRTPGIRITETGRRMMRGNGDFLRWETDPLEPHPLETGRDSELDTGRSSYSSASYYSYY